MLPKNSRIPRKIFPLLIKGSKTRKSGLFLLRFVSGHRSGSRFGFSVSKKISKSAVVRNRMRRAGYRLLRKYLVEIKPDVIAGFSFLKMPKNDEEISQNLELILKDSKLIK